MPDKFVRLRDTVAAKMLELLAAYDLRKDTAEVAWLIRREFAQRGLVLPSSVSAETVKPDEAQS